MRGEQQSFKYRGRGGRRDGAGRPRARDPGVTHDARPPLASRYPVHVTLRAVPGVPNLRRGRVYAVIERALRALLVRSDFRIVHFSVQTNHVHLLVEAASAKALSRGMQALTIRIARGVNRAASRRGRFWRGRYHARILRSPREVRHAVCYVLQNTRRYATTERSIVDPNWIDPRSSGPWFDGWRTLPEGFARPSSDPPRSGSQTWLLREGWRRHGLIPVEEVPSRVLG